jgi:hypothetical protein
LKSSEQRPIGFGKRQQRALADIIRQLIYPLEIVENPLPLRVSQRLDANNLAGAAFRSNGSGNLISRCSK